MKAGTQANVMAVDRRFLAAHLKGSCLMKDVNASKVLMTELLHPPVKLSYSFYWAFERRENGVEALFTKE